MLDKKAHIVLGDINSSIRPWVNMFRNSRDFDEDMFITHEQAEAHCQSADRSCSCGYEPPVPL